MIPAQVLIHINSDDHRAHEYQKHKIHWYEHKRQIPGARRKSGLFIIAKFMFLYKQIRLDLQISVVFLMTLLRDPTEEG